MSVSRLMNKSKAKQKPMFFLLLTKLKTKGGPQVFAWNSYSRFTHARTHVWRTGLGSGRVHTSIGGSYLRLSGFATISSNIHYPRTVISCLESLISVSTLWQRRIKKDNIPNDSGQSKVSSCQAKQWWTGVMYRSSTSTGMYQYNIVFLLAHSKSWAPCQAVRSTYRTVSANFSELKYGI